MFSLQRTKILSVALASGIAASLIALKSARGDLVLEGETESGIETEVVSKSADRETTREAVRASENLEVANTTEGRQEARAAGDVSASFSQAELMRRERQRHEIRNEDLLQVRLEQLRLRDEKRRTRKLLGEEGEDTGEAEPIMRASERGNRYAAISGVETETVRPSQVDRPGVDIDRISSSRAATETVGVSQVSASQELQKTESETSFSIEPRGGLSNYIGTLPFQTNSRFAAGVGLVMTASDSISIDAGYTYGEIGLMLPPSNLFAMQYSMFGVNREPLTMKQNVFDLGARVYLLGKDSKFRPFVGVGAGYMMSYVNYDPNVITTLNQFGGNAFAQDYQINSFLGILSAGAEFRASKSISIGATFRYHTVLNARENTPFNMYGFYPGAAGAFYDPSKAYAGLSLARQAFYSFLIGLNFSL